MLESARRAAWGVAAPGWRRRLGLACQTPVETRSVRGHHTCRCRRHRSRPSDFARDAGAWRTPGTTIADESASGWTMRSSGSASERTRALQPAGNWPPSSGPPGQRPQRPGITRAPVCLPTVARLSGPHRPRHTLAQQGGVHAIDDAVIGRICTAYVSRATDEATRVGVSGKPAIAVSGPGRPTRRDAGVRDSARHHPAAAAFGETEHGRRPTGPGSRHGAPSAHRAVSLQRDGVERPCWPAL
jgi:hypothetical protein